MMNGHYPFSVQDISFDSVQTTQYDLSIFAVGYESRCTQAVNLLDSQLLGSSIVIGFEKAVLSDLRSHNDAVFRRRLNLDPVIESPGLPSYLAAVLADAVDAAYGKGRVPTILIDYSSMRREWYGVILALLARLADPRRGLLIDFLYSVGVYPSQYELALESAVVESIAPLPGMEGLSASRPSSIAVLGLGFSPVAGLGALERLQPDKVFCFYASPGSTAENVETVRRCNDVLIKRSTDVIELPLSSLSTAYRGLAELAWPFAEKFHINILPMGPKPHVLASMLLALTYRSVCCLYGRVRHPSATDISGNHTYSIGRISFHT